MIAVASGSANFVAVEAKEPLQYVAETFFVK